MTDFGSWIQENWYQLGSFFVQCGFLFLAAWFAGKILRTLRASQEQLGALVKLSVGGNLQDRHADSSLRSASNAGPYWLPPSPALSSRTITAPEQNSSGPGFFDWWKAPMGVTTGTSSFHRVLALASDARAFLAFLDFPTTQNGPARRSGRALFFATSKSFFRVRSSLSGRLAS